MHGVHHDRGHEGGHGDEHDGGDEGLDHQRAVDNQREADGVRVETIVDEALGDVFEPRRRKTLAGEFVERRGEAPHRSEATQERALPRLPHPRDIVQGRGERTTLPLRPVVRDREPVRLVSDVLQQEERV